MVDDSRHEGPSNAGVVDDDAGRKYEDCRRPQDLWPVIRLLALRVECGGWPNPPSLRMLNDGRRLIPCANEAQQGTRKHHPHGEFPHLRTADASSGGLTCFPAPDNTTRRSKRKKAGKCRCRKGIRTKVLESWIILGLFNASHMHTPWRYNRHFSY